MKKQTPQPVYGKATCSVCGLDWDSHRDRVGAADDAGRPIHGSESAPIEECVRLLKMELAKRPQLRTLNEALA